MIKMTINRLKRTVADAVFHVAPIWHLTNLRREAYDQLEELHYQVGFCRANKNQLLERMEEIEQALANPQIDKESQLALQAEKRQMEIRIRETEEMEKKAGEVVESYQEALPKLVSQLDLAIQMARQTKSQRATLKMLGSSGAADGSEINEHIKQVRSKAYALSQQLDGHLAANKMKRTRLLTSK